MAINNQNENGIMDGIDLGLPTKSIPDLYMASMLRSMDNLDTLLRNMETPTDWRFLFLTRQFITRITEEEIRENIISELNETLEKIKNSGLDNNERAEASLYACQMAVGQTVSWMDQAMAITTTTVIMPI